MRYLLTLCLLLATAGVQAETYRWTDSAGRTVVSDTPPPGSAKGVAKLGGKPEASDGLSFATKRAVVPCPVPHHPPPLSVSQC